MVSLLFGDVIYFEKVQQLKIVGVYSWYVFFVFGDVYVLFVSINRIGFLLFVVDNIGMGEYFGLVLFCW